MLLFGAQSGFGHISLLKQCLRCICVCVCVCVFFFDCCVLQENFFFKRYKLIKEALVNISQLASQPLFPFFNLKFFFCLKLGGKKNIYKKSKPVKLGKGGTNGRGERFHGNHDMSHLSRAHERSGSILHSRMFTHTFHTNCLMTWFRCGHNTCPMCKDEGINESSRLPICLRHAAYERYKTVRQESRKKNCAQRIKKSIEALKKEEKKLVQLRKKRKAFRNSLQPDTPVKEIVKKARLMNVKIWTKERLVFRKKISIGLSHERIIIPVKQNV